MIQTANSPSKLRQFIKWTLISLALVACIWIGVVVWWQSTQRIITLPDVLFYLVALPAFTLTAIFGFQWVRHRKLKAAQLPKNQPSAIQLDDGNASNQAPEPALPVLAVWGVTAAADNAPAFVEALLEKNHRPRPDASLLDEYGFPLHTSRVKGLDTGPVKEALARIIALQGVSVLQDVEDCRESFLRSLALFSQLLEQICSDWPLAFEAEADANAHSTASIGTLRGTEAISLAPENRLALQIKLMLPASFQAIEQQLALSFLLEKTAQLDTDPQRLHVEIVLSQDDATALLLADQFRTRSCSSKQPQALLLLASESTLCPGVAEDWQVSGRNFCSQTPNGLMMGEAAFAVLLVNQTALPLAFGMPACHLSRVVKARRESSADLPGKPSASTLSAVIGETLANAGIAGEKIGSVACDADHRTSRVLECIGAMMHHMPQLDAIGNRLAINETCGHIGAASVLGGLVAGTIQARDSGYPVLVFSVSHLFERAAAVMLPIEDAPQPS